MLPYAQLMRMDVLTLQMTQTTYQTTYSALNEHFHCLLLSEQFW